MSSLRLAVLTTGRQDYGILRSTLHGLAGDARFTLRLWVGGMHLQERFGRTIEHVRRDGLPVAAELPFLAEPPDAVADTGHAVLSVGEALHRERPDALVLVGDRTETMAAAVAAAVETVPVVHMHGGEETEGAVDNLLRHAITKLAHLHLVSHERHAARVRQMGEDPQCVVVVGAPGLDNMFRTDLPGRDALESDLGIRLADPVVLVTMHPATLGGDPVAEARAVASAMEWVPATYVVTAPNADSGGAAIRDFWRVWSAARERVVVVEALGEARYWGVLRIAAVVLGNSSSGIIEAPQAAVPAVNVGDRQRARMRGRGVRDVPGDPSRITKELVAALAPAERVRLAAEPAPYPEGPAAPRIIEALARWRIPVPPRKRFVDMV